MVRVEFPEVFAHLVSPLERFASPSTCDHHGRIDIHAFEDDAYSERIDRWFEQRGAELHRKARATRADFFDAASRTLEAWSVPSAFTPQVLKGLLVRTFATLAAERGGVLLHGAGFVIDGMAGAFLGRSGAGKSTAVGLLGPDRLLSDDMIVVANAAADPVAYASPMGLATDGPGSAPLRALFLVNQADRFSLERLTTLNAIGKCANAQVDTITAVYAPHRERGYGNLNRMLTVVPCYEMSFSLDGVDREAIREALGGLRSESPSRTHPRAGRPT